MRRKSFNNRNLFQVVLYCTNLAFIKHLYLTSSKFEILSCFRVFISCILIATVSMKIANRAAYFLPLGLPGVKVIVPFWRKKLNLKKTWRLIQCIGKRLKPEEFPYKTNFKKFIIGRVLRTLSKPIDKCLAFLLSS